MKRLMGLLSIVIAGELVVASIILGWWTDSGASFPSALVPRPDLTFLDAVSAQEVRFLQEQAMSDDADDWRALAEIYVLYGLFAEAERCCQRAASRDPEAFWTYLWWGTALYRLGETNESTQKFRIGIRYAEGSLADVCRYCIGLNLLREERQGDAETEFRAAPGYAPADYELAKLLVRSNREKAAVPILDRLIKDHPETEKYWQLRARAARQLGDFTASAEFQDRADRATQVLSSDELTGFLELQIGRHGLDIRLQECRDLLSTGAVAAAAGQLQEILEIEWRQEAADLLADAHLHLGDADQALRILNQAVARSGGTPERLVGLGDVYHRLDDDERAEQFWRRAARLQLNRPAHERLAEFCRQNGNHQESAQHQALALMAGGIAAERAHELDSAAELLQQAVAVWPELSHAWYHLGECRRLLDQQDSAALAYRRCLSLDPYHGRAMRSLDRLSASR